MPLDDREDFSKGVWIHSVSRRGASFQLSVDKVSSESETNLKIPEADPKNSEAGRQTWTFLT